ncbi:toll/interleukin-1 receptor domain-containing protein [Streptomyces sp. NPDC059862]|uniref:toll/interleukin-1 receptor domain-containing protein n=1 Tax=Streptomyces sp. NPDC059862 TaxID=3346975 RepID=UPI003647485C
MVERRTQRYDAFVTYAHADTSIADAVARGLQVFGRAWYQTRVLRVFRDTTSLAASSSLWSALEQALLSSRYLIVLLSPAGAMSPWLNREVTTFLQQHDAGRILLVVTDGEVVWDAQIGDFAQDRSSAVPQALFGVFADEPRWVDLRWARGEHQLTLRDPRLMDTLASLAAVLHGVPLDELAGEHVRQRRRTRYLVFGIVATLTLLVLLSSTLGVLLWREQHSRVDWPVLVGVVAAGGGALLAIVTVRSGWRRLVSRAHRAPPDTGDPLTYQGMHAPAPPFPLLEYFRGRLRRWREIDLYVGPVADTDRDMALQLADTVRRLGQPRLRRGQLRVVVDMRPADEVDNLSDSYEAALRARHYLHLGSPDTVGAEAGNLILQEWLRVHPRERLLLGVARLREDSGQEERVNLAAEAVLPQVLRGGSIDMSGRVFDLRVSATGRAGGQGARDLSELARLVGRLLGVDPHLVTSGGLRALRVARRRSRIEEPLERWNLSETVQLRAHAEIAVHLPEMQSAMAALGQSPLAYFLEILANEDELISREVVPRAAELLAQAERNAARETWIRMGQPRRRGKTAEFLGPCAMTATTVGLAALAGSAVSRSAAVLYPALVVTVSGVSALVGTLLANRRAAGFEVRRQKAFISRYAIAVAAAVEALQDAIQGSVLLPFLRQRLNEELTVTDGFVAVRYDPAVLTTQTPDRFRLETAAFQRTAARIGAPGGAAIGLAGPRGVGKTTLLSFLAQTRLFHHPHSSGSQLGVQISAPVRYDSADFITQILATVCREVIRTGGSSQRLAPHGYLAAATSTVKRTAAAVLLAIALTAIPVAAGWVEANGRQVVLAALVGLALVCAVVAFDASSTVQRMHRRLRYTSATVGGSMIARSSGQRIRDLTEAAGVILNRLYFREERSLSAGLKLPVLLGIEANGSGNLLYEGRPWTTPEIVQQFRQFVGALNNSGYRVVIAVDELDKVDDDEEVIRLLNDLKTLFGLANCYFLVAVSLSAMVRFQQRGLPFQDAFESALDEVISVEPLTATETVELLQRRLTGIPAPSALLCHIVGAGLPRDVIRALRHLAAAATEARPSPLLALVTDDLHTRLAAARTRLQLTGKDPTERVRRILDLTQLPFDSRQWLEVLAPILAEVWQRLRPGSVARSPGEANAEDREDDRLMLFIGWAVTTAEFATSLTDGSHGNRAAQTSIAEKLAVCRRMLAIDMRDAFVSLTQIRAALDMTALHDNSTAP